MGASDFVEGDHHTSDDVPACQTDYALEHFSINSPLRRPHTANTVRPVGAGDPSATRVWTRPARPKSQDLRVNS